MPYSTKILLDSISPAGRRLTTWELTYPRMVHAELMTHKRFSRNSASSRAIPNEKLRQRVKDDPALPVWWGKNQAGMQAREELSNEPQQHVWMPDDPICVLCGVLRGNDLRCTSPRGAAQRQWLRARDLMLDASEQLAAIGLHKQLCNRLIEPWMFITVIVTASTFENWFHLRDHKDAQPEIAWVARDMHEKFRASTPKKLKVGGWHLPLIQSDEWDYFGEAISTGDMSYEDAIAKLKKVSVGRVARVSYLTHDGRRDLMEDIALHDKLLAGLATGEPLHMSPFEHVAQALDDPDEPSGNFTGWKQYRKEIAGEAGGEPPDSGVRLSAKEVAVLREILEARDFSDHPTDAAEKALLKKLGGAS